MVSHPEESRDEVWLWSFAAVLLRSRYLILACALLTGAVVGTIMLLLPRQYEASASFIPQEPATLQPSGLGALAAQFGMGSGRPAAASPQFYADLLQSREVVRELLLTNFQIPGDDPFSGNLLDYFKLEAEDEQYRLSKAEEKLEAIMSVAADRVTGVVSVEVWTRVPGLSQQMIDRLIQLVSDYNLERRQSQAGAEREFLEQRMENAQQELNAAEQRLTNFHASNRIIGSPALLATEAKLQREIAMAQELYTTLAQSFESARLDEIRATPVITLIERPDGFIRPRPKGTIQKTFAALVAGGLLGVAVAFFREYTARARQHKAADYQEVVRLWREAIAELKPWRTRRAS